MAAVSPAGPPPTIRQSSSGSLIRLQRRVMTIVPPASQAYSRHVQREGPIIMRPWIAALLLASLPAQGFAQAPAAPAPASIAGRIESLEPALDAIFERYRTEQHVPGLVYGIVAD